jgi:hypothetical protein
MIDKGIGRLFEYDPTTFSQDDKFFVIGDIHGDFDVLESALKRIDLEKDRVLFLGDYADRGPNGVEVIEKVNELITGHQNIKALKGNHEDYDVEGEPKFNPCDLPSEVLEKRGLWSSYYKRSFQPFVEKLYLSAILPGSFLFVHGGISSRIDGIESLRRPSYAVEEDVLWSDPSDSEEYEGPNERGAGVAFGNKVTQRVMSDLGVKKIIRSHEPRKAPSGPRYSHQGTVVTTSCTKAYGGKPFILSLKPGMPEYSEHFFI